MKKNTHHSKSTIVKMSLAKIGKKQSESHAGNNALARIGMKFTEERKKNISQSLKGNKCRWKGGRFSNNEGYILIHKPEHPFCNHQGYILEHRLIMEKHLNRYLAKNEIVHHKNRIKSDNNINNLYLHSSKSKHQIYHSINTRNRNTLGQLTSNL